MLMGIGPEKHGSFEDFAIQICREMTIRGHIPHLAFPTPLPDWYKENIQNAEGRLAPDKLITTPWAPGSLWQYLKTERIDVVHLHLVNTLVAWLWNQMTELPLVMNLHVAKEYGSGNCLDLFASLRARLIYRAAKLIAISDFMRDYALHLGFGLQPDQVIRIYNGVDTDRFRPVQSRAKIRQKIGWKPDAVMLVTVSHLRKEKGVDLILKAFAKVASDQPIIQLAVVGDGPELRALKALADNLDIAERLHWLGRRNDAEMILPAADVFVLTPACDEAFGYVFAEAQSCGLPVITCRSGGIPEIICNGKTGMILDKNDVNGLASAIARIASDVNLRTEMAQHARANVLAHFDIRDQVKTIVDLYEKELKGKGPIE